MGKTRIPAPPCLTKRHSLLLCLLTCLLLCFTLLPGCGARQLPLTPQQEEDKAAQNATTALPYRADFAYAETHAAPAPASAPAPAPAPPSSADSTKPKTPASSPAPPDGLLRSLRAASLLLKLQNSPPDDMQGLEFRIDKDEAEALRLLHAFGYYDGSVSRTVTALAAPNAPAAPEAAPAVPGTIQPSDADPAAPNPAASGLPSVNTTSTAAPQWQVHLTLTPGPRYTIGTSVLHYHGLAEGQQPDEAPATLEDAGLKPGAPADAARILRAVERIPELLGQRGYPLAQVKGSRYAVDKNTRQLFATVLVDSGPRARMGRVRMQGESAVHPAYLEKLQLWENSPLWDQGLVEDYRDLLTRQGLFRSIELKAVPAAQAENTSMPPLHSETAMGTANVTASMQENSISDSIQNNNANSHNTAGTSPSPTPVYDLLATVADAPQRTVGGGLNYESNRGPGVQAYWEHRNLLGQGERFRAETSLWQDSQFMRGTFRKPAFLDRAQELTAEGWLRNEDSIAYTQRAAWLSAGVERRLWGSLYASAGAGIEGGDLQDPLHPRQGYTMTSLPLNLRYEGAGGAAQLDPVRGWRASLGVRPTWGYYGGAFTVTPTRLGISGYYPLGRMTRSDEQDATGEGLWRVVLAARGAAGTLWRGDSQRIPASARYYGGGGGSVRGYAYQSLGPRDAYKDPLGGSSFAELSLEARVRITDDISIVPFLDGGNVYSGVSPGFEKDGTSTGLQWGAGLGLRYHTAVGPLRLDVATPLNPRKDDGPVFLYISIGQSF